MPLIFLPKVEGSGFSLLSTSLFIFVQKGRLKNIALMSKSNLFVWCRSLSVKCSYSGCPSCFMSPFSTKIHWHLDISVNVEKNAWAGNSHVKMWWYCNRVGPHSNAAAVPIKKDRQRGKQLGTEMTAMLPQAKGCVRLLGVGRDKLFLRSFRGCRACWSVNY